MRKKKRKLNEFQIEKMNREKKRLEKAREKRMKRLNKKIVV